MRDIFVRFVLSTACASLNGGRFMGPVSNIIWPLLYYYIVPYTYTHTQFVAALAAARAHNMIDDQWPRVA